MKSILKNYINIINKIIKTHNIFSFNISKCTEEFGAIKSQITKFSKDSIICLQEWGFSESVAFNNYFTFNNYFLFAAYSSLPEKDFRGVAIAVPLEKYKIISMGKRNTRELIEKSNGILPEAIYDMAKKLLNEVCWVVLEDNKTKENFIVFNYHLPYIQWRTVMDLHVNSLRMIIDDVSQKFRTTSVKESYFAIMNCEEVHDLPLIVCGSLNSGQYSSTCSLFSDERRHPCMRFTSNSFQRSFTNSMKYFEDDHTVKNIQLDDKTSDYVVDYIFTSNFYALESKIHKNENLYHYPVGAKLTSENHIKYYAEIKHTHHSEPSIRISQEKVDEHDFYFELRFDEGKKVQFYGLITGSRILSIPYRTKDEGKKLMRQIYAKCNGFPPSGDDDNLLDDAPIEILKLRCKDNWCFCLIVDGIKIEESLIVRPFS